MTEVAKRTPRSLLIRAADRAGLLEESFRHPFNPSSEIHGYDLARAVGLARAGVMLLRLPGRHESYAPHAHAALEEWLFVLGGRGTVDIGDESYEIGPGDFVGFPPGKWAHHLRNPNADELVYLCGGERSDLDVVDYPAAGRRVVRVGSDVKVYPARSGEKLFP